MHTNDGIKRTFFKETRLFLVLFFFIFLFSLSLNIYQNLLFGAPLLSSIPYGYLALEALIISKIIILGRLLKLGERFLEKPLIIPTLYKTGILCLFVALCRSLEFILHAYFQGSSLTEALHAFLTLRLNILLGKLPLFFFEFLLLTIILELSQELGNDNVLKLFFTKKRKH